MLNDSSVKFYQKKEKLQKRARESYKDLPEKEKEKNQEFACKPYRNHSEEKETRTWWWLI